MLNFDPNAAIIAVLICFVILLAVLIYLLFFLKRVKWEMSYLNENVEPLGRTLEKQHKTLETMGGVLQIIEARYIETKRLGDLYKSLTSELPAAVDNYQKIIKRLKDETGVELEKAQAAKDEELKKFKEKELEGLEAKERLMSDLPGLFAQLHKLLSPINERLNLFSERGKYPTLALLSYEARYGKTLLASMGKHPAPLYQNHSAEAPENGADEQPFGKKEEVISNK